MDLKKSVSMYRKNPRMIWCSLGNHHLLNWMPDAWYLKLIYRAKTGQRLNLKNPVGFNEKLQWLKLYDRKPEYTQMVDKYTVRSYIADKIGEQYLIPLLGVWDDPHAIDFSKLPNQFVLKCTHDSGSVRICKDKKSFRPQEAVDHLARCLKRGTYWPTREWPYKYVKPRVIAEQYMEDESGEGLQDYKVMCFHGEPKLIELHRGRYGVHTEDFYDIHWHRTNISQANIGLPKAQQEVEAPTCLKEMLEKSALLSREIPNLRVDWYCVHGKLYFGELTFFDGSGMDLFDRKEDEQLLGSWIHLPEQKTIAR